VLFDLSKNNIRVQIQVTTPLTQNKILLKFKMRKFILDKEKLLFHKDKILRGS